MDNPTCDPTVPVEECPSCQQDHLDWLEYMATLDDE